MTELNDFTPAKRFMQIVVARGEGPKPRKSVARRGGAWRVKGSEGGPRREKKERHLQREREKKSEIDGGPEEGRSCRGVVRQKNETKYPASKNEENFQK